MGAVRASGTPSAPLRQGPERRLGRDRVRLLPPLRSGHRAHAGARPRRLPLLHRLAARRAGRTRPRQRGRPRLLRPSGRRPARRRHPPVRLALPLGPPAGSRGRRRLALARDAGGVRRVRRGRGPTARRPGPELADAERAVLRLVARLRTRPPRSRQDRAPAAIAAAHHVLLSHGLAVQALRRESPESEVGIVLDSWPVYPASDDPRDAEAAKEQDGFRNRLFFDPVLRGTTRRTSSSTSVTRRPRSRRRPGRDLRADRLRGAEQLLADDHRGRFEGKPQNVTNGGPTTEMGWEIYPKGIYDVLTRLHREYGVQNLYVTENGGAFPDVLLHDGRVEDRDRIDYLHKYLGAVGRAIADGVPSGLLRVVAARQLRVGLRLLPALRAPLRRLLDARARAQVELLLVPGPDRRRAAARARARPSRRPGRGRPGGRPRPPEGAARRRARRSPARPAPTSCSTCSHFLQVGHGRDQQLGVRCIGFPKTFSVAPISTMLPRRRITVRSLM